MVQYIRSDLDFILQQIKIAEAHSAGTPLTALVPSPVLPHGLRTVDGSYNNLVPGQEHYGSADQPFPRMTTPQFRPGYEATSGTVVDAEVRTISNLIADQSSNNDAAAEAADYSGSAPVENLVIPNVAPDVGLSAPFNSWMTFFGQFFDHGLDLVNKGGSGTVFIPLQPDDPLYVEGSPTNFMVLTRATNLPGADGVLGTADDIHEHTNQTTPFVDQNQTYTSHASHQVFLREYALNEAGDPVATGRFLNGDAGGLATWADVKEQARTLLGIELTDADVTNVPLLATDQYGMFIRGPNGFPQIVMAGADGKGGTADDFLVEGDPLNPISTAGAVRTGHAFLDDISHAAAPRNSNGSMKTADSDDAVGLSEPGTYDDELLDAHFITGDGRGNENIGLTAVHTVFHAEHNRLVQHTKDVVLAEGDLAFLTEWLMPGTAPTTFPTTQAEIAALQWNGERLFQSAKFGTEMQYQHLVFEEFARKVQPQVDVFIAPVGYDSTIDPAIVAEFAHTVYRFGHSMLTEQIERIDADFNKTEIDLIDAFLNPLAFDNGGAMTAEEATASIVRGMTRQVGNEIDEFVTGAVRNNLLGLPLDLAAINLARGRDTGIPSLNAARREFYAATGDSQLKPYVSWSDFAQNLKNPASVINFIAAYGTHESIVNATTLEDKREAAALLVLGGSDAPADRLAFLNSTGAWASNPNGVTTTGLDAVDFWIGGLAEKKMPFGGMLGSTFGFVFETQLENLQDGDRFYYLSRTDGMNFFNELENNSFASIIMKNTGLKHLPADVFSTPGFILEVDQTQQRTGLDEAGEDGEQGTDDDEIGLDGIAGNSDPFSGDPIVPEVIRGDHYLRYNGDQHVVLGGTEQNDTLISSEGDDSLWGDGGNDVLEGGFGNDNIDGGDGDDIISDIGGDDVIKGGKGNDVINGGNGIDLIIAGDGSDFVVTGPDVAEVFAGTGNDFILGNTPNEVMNGNEGDDWIEVGLQDGPGGDNADPFGLDTIAGNDVFIGDGGFDEYIGEGGDDIMVGTLGPNRNEGMSGFDWVTYKDLNGVYADLNLEAFDETPIPPSPDTALDRYAQVEGLSGSHKDDVIKGDDEDAAGIAAAGARGSVLTNVALISGLQDVLGAGVTSFGSGNILLGGGGSDILEGRGGDDIIDGDRWLNVRISVRDKTDPSLEIDSADSLTELVQEMFAGTYNPGQLQIVREILNGGQATDIDTVVFSDNFANYDITANDDGSLTIAHTRGTQTDGVDRVMNVERFQFADELLYLDGTNLPPTGTVTISDLTPSEDQVLTATQAFDDPNGIVAGSVQFSWEAEIAPNIWRAVATGAQYQPLGAQVGQRLRVVASFTDLQGVRETVISAPTAAVDNINDAATGAPAINDTTPTEGHALTVSPGTIADPDGMATSVITYQWQMLDGLTWTDVGAGANFTPGQAQVGRQLRVVATFTDDGGSVEQLISPPTGIVGDQFVGTTGNNTFNGTAGDDDASGLAGTDVLNGLGGDDLLDGGAGNDTLNGGDGADTLIGGDGNDTLNGGAGADLMSGGGSSDVYVVDDAGDLVVELANQGSDDTVQTALASHTLAVNVEHLTFTGTGGFTGTGNALANEIQGGSGADNLSGGAGADTLIGGAGNDVLDGGTGADTLNGGAGDDSYFVDVANDQIVEGSGGGIDTVFSTSAEFVLGTQVENLQHVGANATNVEGNGLNNVITGGNGADTLDGDSGNDTLDGGAGNDTLVGGTGNDRLIGGAGNDQMNGGTGEDRFVFEAGFGDDRITGFDATPGGGQDRLDLIALGITSANFASLVSITEGADNDDTLITIGSDSILLVNVSVSNVTQADFFLAP